MISAYDFAIKTKFGSGEDSFSFDNKKSAEILRQLADGIERNDIILQKLRVVSDTTLNKFAMTTLRVVFYEMVPDKTQ